MESWRGPSVTRGQIVRTVEPIGGKQAPDRNAAATSAPIGASTSAHTSSTASDSGWAIP